MDAVTRALPWLAPLGMLAATTAAAAPYEVRGQAWADFGRLMHVSDSLIATGDATANTVLNLQGNVLQGMGAQFTVHAGFGNHWDAALGFGAHKISHSLGSGSFSYLSISMFQNFLTESRLTFYTGEKAAPDFSISLGNFPYKYQRETHNLGLYLLRGPVYPGFLMGGFQDFAVDTTKSTMLGAKIHHAIGNFSHDLILNNERDIPPTLDWSLAYIAKYRAFEALEIGGGVNFYRLIANDPNLHEPGKLSDVNLSFRRAKYFEADTTVIFTHQGTKVGAFFSLDLNRMAGFTGLGPQDLKLYGEGAVLGIKNYGTTYGDIGRRIPIMLGFNLPAFRLLDLVSLEVEWYGALFRNDLANVGYNNVVADWTLHEYRTVPSPKPPSYGDYGIDSLGNWVNRSGDTLNVKGTPLDKENLTTDNLKWSLLLVKSLNRKVRLLAQIANDHYRPAPIATGLITSRGGTAEAFTSTSDWYFMLRLGYFF